MPLLRVVTVHEQAVTMQIDSCVTAKAVKAAKPASVTALLSYLIPCGLSGSGLIESCIYAAGEFT